MCISSYPSTGRHDSYAEQLRDEPGIVLFSIEIFIPGFKCVLSQLPLADLGKGGISFDRPGEFCRRRIRIDQKTVKSVLHDLRGPANCCGNYRYAEAHGLHN